MKKWEQLTNKEKVVNISAYPQEARNDKNDYVSLCAFRALGYTKVALNDNYPDIRIEAFRAFGFTSNALQDSNYYIRKEASLYFENY